MNSSVLESSPAVFISSQTVLVTWASTWKHGTGNKNTQQRHNGFGRISHNVWNFNRCKVKKKISGQIFGQLCAKWTDLFILGIIGSFTDRHKLLNIRLLGLLPPRHWHAKRRHGWGVFIWVTSNITLLFCFLWNQNVPISSIYVPY